MTHSFRSAALVAAFSVSAFALVTPAFADTIRIERDTTQYSSAHGGEIMVLSYSGGYQTMGSGAAVTGGLFQTFCLEADISLPANTDLDYTISTGAIGGGVSGGNPDPIDAQTAYLFSQFWLGTLANYDYTLGSARVASATSLQLAIWEIEGELTGTIQTDYDNDSQAQSWVSEAATAVASGGSWFGMGIDNVRVINPTSSTGGDVQSMLVLVPVPPAVLSGLSLLLGMGGFGLLRRRSRLTLV